MDLQNYLTMHERLKQIGILTLEYRRERAGMVQMYNISRNKNELDTSKMFTMHTNNTRGHHFKLFKKQFKLNPSKTSPVTELSTFGIPYQTMW